MQKMLWLAIALALMSSPLAVADASPATPGEAQPLASPPGCQPSDTSLAPPDAVEMWSSCELACHRIFLLCVQNGGNEEFCSQDEADCMSECF